MTHTQTKLFPNTNIDWLILFKETLAVYIDNYTKAINTK